MARQQDDRTADRIAMAMTLIEEVDQRWTGLARHLSNSGMDHNDDLIARLARRQERYWAEARAGRP
jgi:hypothetical protein